MPDDGVPRDRFGRPLIRVPGEEKLQPYKRASSFGKPLDDLNNIIAWRARLVAKGFVENPHLQLKFVAAADKRASDAVLEEAFLAAGGSVKAEVGTSMHSLTERLDRGIEVGYVPPSWADDLKAYEQATAHMEHLEIETFSVCDEWRVGGTPDRISRLTAPLTLASGEVLPAGWVGVVDLKTGSVGFPHGFSIQLALYAHSVGYDHATETRRDLPDVDQERAILVHLPAGEAHCELHALDIKRGWAAVPLAADVDIWRKEKRLTTPIELEAV